MTDTQKEITCPACGTQMTKVFVVDKGIYVDVCDKGCGGIFFDAKEIQEFSDENADISEIKQLLVGKKFKNVNEFETRICPACNHKMIKTKVFGIEIDTCYTCGGVFLDNGEFEKVRANFKKPKRVEQVQFNNPDSDIVLQEFYNYKQDSNLKSISPRQFGRNIRNIGLLFRTISKLF